jgi:Histidine kinase
MPAMSMLQWFKPANGADDLAWLPNRSHWVVTQTVCLLVALVLALAGTPFFVGWMYSVVIGTLCGLMIDVGRKAVSRWKLQRPGPHHPELQAGWPGWGWMLPLIAVSCASGYVAGTHLVDALTGYSSAKPTGGSWRGWLAVLAVSLAAGLGATWFFRSRARLAAVEAEVAKVARQAAESQLRLLESQLEPHMLFNTLANLRALIGVDPARAQAMLDRLIDFLRATLGASRATLHPLSAEFSRLADYLALMQIRMGDRLQVEFDLPAPLASVQVPPLLLQPLVENSIKHGLEPQRAGGLIRVTARQEAGHLLLQVLDTGRGPEAPPVPGNAPGGFGLTQVRERLATLYGQQAGLVLAAAPQGPGTLATVRMPMAAA